MNIRRYFYGALLICIFAFLFLGNGSPIGAEMSRNDEDPETTEVVVKLSAAAGDVIDAVNVTYGTTTIEVLVDSAGIYRLRVPNGVEAKDVAGQMAEDARLLYAEPNYNNEAPEGNPLHIGTWGGPDDSGADEQYAVEMLGLADAHSLRRGSGVTVAVLDTGVQLDHPDLVNHWTTARYDFVDDDNNPTDTADGNDSDNDGFFDEAFGHGTHIAGIIHLVAPDAQIMPLRVLNADGHGNIFVVAEAVQFAVEHGADVINLSLGSPEESALMEDILKDVTAQHNVVVVAAVGNLNNNDKQFPASEDEILAVTSIDKQSQKSDFANFGDWIDVSAPGEAILSAFPMSTHASWSGTSMAVPFVAGHAALVRSAVPTMSALEIRSYIQASAQPIDVQNPGFQGQLGTGRINIGGSIRAICNDDGSCHAPDLTGQIILESRAIVESRPANGLTGTWVIDGSTFVADTNTEFRQEKGALAVGTCADVEYRNTSPFSALRIRSREIGECSQLPTATPTPAASATNVSSTTPAPSQTTASTPAPNETSSPMPTSEPTVQPGASPTPSNPTTDHSQFLPFVIR